MEKKGERDGEKESSQKVSGREGVSYVSQVPLAFAHSLENQHPLPLEWLMNCVPWLWLAL